LTRSSWRGQISLEPRCPFCKAGKSHDSLDASRCHPASRRGPLLEWPHLPGHVAQRQRLGGAERQAGARQERPHIALQEAWEEAGLVGFLHEEALGHYRYEKGGAVYEVKVFLMEVTEVHDDWPEAHERRRLWCLPQHAHRRVYQPGLRELLRDVQANLLIS
jgi:hypothetical protein